jgi:hypothetical protein
LFALLLCHHILALTPAARGLGHFLAQLELHHRLCIVLDQHVEIMRDKAIRAIEARMPKAAALLSGLQLLGGLRFLVEVE